jgi:hypothetical protein
MNVMGNNMAQGTACPTKFPKLRLFSRGNIAFLSKINYNEDV